MEKSLETVIAFDTFPMTFQFVLLSYHETTAYCRNYTGKPALDLSWPQEAYDMAIQNPSVTTDP